MAAAARRRVEAQDPPLDPDAVPRSLARERAKRRARIEHRRELQRARVRFWVLIGALLFFAIIIGLTVVDQIQAVFGL